MNYHNLNVVLSQDLISTSCMHGYYFATIEFEAAVMALETTDT